MSCLLGDVIGRPPGANRALPQLRPGSLFDSQPHAFTFFTGIRACACCVLHCSSRSTRSASATPLALCICDLQLGWLHRLVAQTLVRFPIRREAPSSLNSTTTVTRPRGENA